MGCDIHFRAFFYDRNSKEYIDMETFNSQMDVKFPEVVYDRYYDFFGLFGNTARSYYPEMDNLEYGFPEFLEKIDKNYYDNIDLHTRCYCTIGKFRNGIIKYIKKLDNPALMYGEDSDEYLDWKEGKISLKYEKEYNRYLKRYLKNVILPNIRKFYKLFKTAQFKMLCDLNGYDIKINDTVFVFAMDS